jgi:hypothetical protein
MENLLSYDVNWWVLGSRRRAGSRPLPGQGSASVSLRGVNFLYMGLFLGFKNNR